MRELTKSMMRFSWAVPLFGLRQMTNLALPTTANVANATRAFETVTGAVERELGSAFADLFKAGDQLADAMTGGCSSGATFNPMSWIPKPCSGSLGSGSASTSSGTASTGTASTGATGAGATASPAAEPQPTASNDVGGWGPIPSS